MMNSFLLLLLLLTKLSIITTDTVWESNGVQLVRVGNRSTLVNDIRVGFQGNPIATHKANNNFTIIWNDINHGVDLWGSAYNDLGEVVANDFSIINNSISGISSITGLQRGGSFLAWATMTGDILGNIYDSNFKLINDTFMVNNDLPGSAYNIMLATLASGNVAATWQNVNNGTRTTYLAIFNPQGYKQLNDTPITGFAGDYFNRPYIVPLLSGSFVILLEDVKDFGFGVVDNAIVGIGYYPNGTLKQSLFRIDTDAFDKQYNPKGTELLNGGLAIAWRTMNEIYYRVYHSNFLPVTGVLNMTAGFYRNILNIDISGFDSYGGWLFAWDGLLGAENDYTVFAQFLNADGSFLGTSFEVATNTSKKANKQHPAITTFYKNNNRIIFTYSRRHSGGSDDVYLQAFDLVGLTCPNKIFNE